MMVIETPRLILRTWQDSDAETFLEMNQDPLVIEFLRGPMSAAEVSDFMLRMNQNYSERGYTLWAAELKQTQEFIGFIGLNYTDWPATFTPAVEIGWRLHSRFWGAGYATEGAQACLEYAFKRCGLAEIVSFTVPQNLRSRRVMEKIGLQHDKHADFAHPRLPADHPLSKHVLYRLSATDFLSAKLSPSS